ncbi:peptidoglycan-associated lipoprotein Pal, partial [Thermodesulfobacteriota bacterium]
DRRRAIKETSLSEEQRKAEEARRAKAEKAERELFVSQDIYFEYDSYTLLPDAQVLLREKAKWLQRYPAFSVIIEGHCDKRGTNEYNIALGERRAESVKAFLTNLGIAASRSATVSYGEERPLDTGDTEAAWAKNRRAHFIIK